MTYIEITLESQKILANNVNDFLISTGQTMEELGIACGSNKQQIYKIKNCQINPSLEFLDKLAFAMNCSVKDLFTESFYINKKNSIKNR